MDNAKNSYKVLHAGKDKQVWGKTESRKPQPLCYDVMLFTVKIIGMKSREKPNCRMHQVPPLECRPPVEPQKAQRQRERMGRGRSRGRWGSNTARGQVLLFPNLQHSRCTHRTTHSEKPAVLMHDSLEGGWILRAVDAG